MNDTEKMVERIDRACMYALSISGIYCVYKGNWLGAIYFELFSLGEAIFVFKHDLFRWFEKYFLRERGE